ncbi:methionine ABC transporter ATP-binding protein [Alkalicoccobacillus plakortidis]|uniref:Methionine ABC transporter ATP-binding protein n=1 Tax=Alkalicoccobacillus plakortidis TaxID=444060 RepID=A0ABT0XMX5_9BACI|nr:methionine ABC transporter ATP-binding protein [Alkalicoccobacillus plakortidis]MCM2677254.1 methionine ABC transporter ATP-binding protein [Alkalicoccobacillus plakortidis]
MIEFKNVSKVFKTKEREVKALDEVNFRVDKGQISGVIGFSGAGKSTLIRSVNLLERPTDGEVIVNGQSLTLLKGGELQKAKRNIGMIFQHFNLLQSKTVFENVAVPLRLVRTPQAELKKRVRELLDFVGLSDKADSYPEQLSGGQKQRIGIARALASNPAVLLCDEATSALDPETTSSILQLLKRVNEEFNVTILIITHEMGVIREICDRVAVMEEGRIIEEGTVLDIFSKPQHQTTKNFVRSVFKDQIPASVRKILEKGSEQIKIYKIEFIGESSGKPLLSELVRNFDVDVNVLFGNITEIQDTPFGSLTVELQGDPGSLESAFRFIKEKELLVSEVKLDA